MASFTERFQGVVAIDGKVLRRSFDRASGKSALHMVSAWGCEQRLVLAQIATDAKSNEITAIPLLLKHLDLKGALVTMDAMGTQTNIARAIRAGSSISRLACRASACAAAASCQYALFSMKSASRSMRSAPLAFH